MGKLLESPAEPVKTPSFAPSGPKTTGSEPGYPPATSSPNAPTQVIRDNVGGKSKG